MKKSKLIGTLIAGMSIACALSGCSMGGTEATIRDNLSRNLNNLTSVVKRMDTLDSHYLPSEDEAIITSIATPPQKYSVQYLNEDEDVENGENSDESNIRRTPYTHIRTTYNPRFTTRFVAYGLNPMDARMSELHLVSNDVNSADNTYRQTKDELLGTIDELKSMIDEIDSSGWNPTTDQKNALKNYIDELRNSITRLDSTIGQMNNTISDISRTGSDRITSSYEELNSNFMRILNHLDIRIAYLESTLSTLSSLRNIILDSMTSEQLPDSSDNETIQQMPGDTILDGTDQDRIMVDSNREDPSTDDVDNTTRDNTVDNSTPSTTDTMDDNANSSNNANNAQNSVNQNSNDTVINRDDTVTNNNTTDNNSNNNDTNTRNDANNDTNNINDNLVDNSTQNDNNLANNDNNDYNNNVDNNANDNVNDRNNESIKNIDTYIDNNLNNIDTMDPYYNRTVDSYDGANRSEHLDGYNNNLNNNYNNGTNMGYNNSSNMYDNNVNVRDNVTNNNLSTPDQIDPMFGYNGDNNTNANNTTDITDNTDYNNGGNTGIKNIDTYGDNSLDNMMGDRNNANNTLVVN